MGKVIPLRPEIAATAGASPVPDSALAVTLTVAQLQEIIRGEIRAVMGHGGNPTLEPLLDAEEIAKILGVDTGYIYSQARAKKIPSVKLGKYRKFSSSQLKKWLDRKNSS